MLTLFAELLSATVMNSRTQIASLQTLQTLLHETTFNHFLSLLSDLGRAGSLWLSQALSSSLRISLALSGFLWLAQALSGSLLLSEFAYKALAWFTRPLLGL